ncbi:MAG: type II secretion system protein GspE [Actinobacteria bacterium]|nr:MAG: type II secretion system protein GspE [Actinomycetota bacterium]
MRKEQLLGEILLQEKLIKEEDLTAALRDQEKSGRPLGRILVDMGALKEEQLMAILAAQAGVEYVNLADIDLDRTTVAMVSEKTARKWNLIPIHIEDDHLVVAMSNPSNIMALDELKLKTGYKIKPVVSSSTDVVDAINHQYGLNLRVEEDTEEGDAESLKVKEIIEDAPIVKLVNLIIVRAVEEKASDIHIEPQEKDLRVRYRIDGVLRETMRLPKRLQSAVLSRYKVMANMDIAEIRKPQDGHASLNIRKRNVDFRVATLPTVYGERIVLRILEKESILLKLDDLGFSKGDLERYRSVFTKPYGTILVTGPTGSGKSTTLYATLNILNKPEKNIVTIEDPVEYRLKGLNQIQINIKAGLTFSKGLRSILRASPDILMVGEIRDGETAQIAIEAALTGHLVMSTLHTNDAPGAISRLIEMGVEPFLVSSSINCVQAQRLARRLCEECKQEYRPDKKALEEIGFPLKDGKVPKLYRPKGCKKCASTGYKGRVGLYEIMLMSKEVKRLTVERASAEEINEVALKDGMSTLKQDGFKKVLAGMTSIEEVLRVAA